MTLHALTSQGHRHDHKMTMRIYFCLLYTSDAADERSSVDLGGRRIIKKKKEFKIIVRSRQIYQINTKNVRSKRR